MLYAGIAGNVWIPDVSCDQRKHGTGIKDRQPDLYDPGEVENKDIIAFYSSLKDGGIITHRVVENHVSSGTFQTKGDANAREDPALIPYDNYIGSVKLALPYMGKIFTILTSPYGKVAAACVVGLGVILNLIGACREEEYEEDE